MSAVITIDGLSGSGKSTVAGILAKRLSAKVFDCGVEFRAIATRRGMDIVDVITDTDFRAEVYDKCSSLEGDVIVVGRDGANWYPNALNIYLDVPEDIRRDRVKKQGRELRDDKVCDFFTDPKKCYTISDREHSPEFITHLIERAYDKKKRPDSNLHHCGTCTCSDVGA